MASVYRYIPPVAVSKSTFLDFGNFDDLLLERFLQTDREKTMKKTTTEKCYLYLLSFVCV